MDFLGEPVALERKSYPYPTPDAVIGFVRHALPLLSARLPPALAARIAGIGIAQPFQLWNWAQFIGAPQSEMDAWRHRNLQAEVAALPAFRSGCRTMPRRPAGPNWSLAEMNGRAISCISSSRISSAGAWC